MLGPRHLPTYLEAVNFETDLEKHHKKLVQIHNGQKKKLFDKDAGSNAGREKVIKFHNSEKALAIEKDNELLLGKLVEISRKRKGHLFPLNEPTNIPKSLNSNARKKEKDRIAAENEAFARRLLSQQPSFNRRKLDDDFNRHEERVKLMQKKVMLGSSKIKLPPIQYNKYDEEPSRKSQSGKEKRNITKELSKKKRRKSNKIDEREEIDEETRERAETNQKDKEKEAQQLKELQEQFRQEEEKEKKLQEEKERKEKEEADQKAREAQEELEKAEKLRKEEEEKKKQLEAQNQAAGTGTQ